MVRTRYATNLMLCCFVQTLIPFYYLSDNTIHINTPYSHLLGKAPIMVISMTLSTVKGNFVSTILSAGFHVEFTGGGHYDATALHAKVTEILFKFLASVSPWTHFTLTYSSSRSSCHCGRIWGRAPNRGLLCRCWCSQHRQGCRDHQRTTKCGYQAHCFQAQFGGKDPTSHQHRGNKSQLSHYSQVDWWMCW